MLLVNTVEHLLSLKYPFWRKMMMKVLRHGAQIPRMTHSMKINARTILYNSLVEYRLQRIVIFFASISVRVESLWHAPPRCETTIRSQARHVFCISKIYFYFSLVPIAMRMFGSAHLALTMMAPSTPSTANSFPTPMDVL